MKLIFLTSLISNLAIAEVNSKESLHYYVGEDVQVCHQPDSIIHRPDVSGSPYFLNYERDNSSTYLTIVVWERDIPNLEINPLTYFKTENFCVSGKITSYRNKKQIVLREQSQLTISKK